MFTTTLCGFSATALAFEFDGQLALGRGCLLPDPPQSPVCLCMHTHGHTLVSLSSCQVCSVCMSGGRIEWVIILGMETQENFF